MGINRAEQGLGDQLIRDIEQLKRDVRDIKTAQPIGADVLSLDTLPPPGFVFATTFTLYRLGHATESNMANVNTTLSPASETLTLWNVLHSFRVDVNDLNHRWPRGSAITPQIELDLSCVSWLDLDESNDSTNTRKYISKFINFSTTTDYVIFYRLKAYLPKLSGTDVA